MHCKKIIAIFISLILLCCKEEKQAKLLDEKESKESQPCISREADSIWNSIWESNIPKNSFKMDYIKGEYKIYTSKEYNIAFFNLYKNDSLSNFNPMMHLRVEYKFIEDESDLLREFSDSYFRSKEEIMKYLREDDILFRDKYRDYLRIYQCFNGKIVSRFVIGGYSGKIREAVILSSTTGHPDFDNEIKKIIEKFKFKPSDNRNNTTVTVAFYFLERLSEKSSFY